MAAFANVREVCFYYYTHTHTHTHTHTYPTLNASSWLTEKTTHTLAHAHTAQTESQSRLLIPITHTHTPSAVPYGEQRRWLHVGSMGTPVATAVSSGDTPLTLTERHTERDRQQRESLRVRHISAAPDDFIHTFHAVDGKLSHNLSDTFLVLCIFWFML